MKVNVIYWTGTGNTEAMAEYVVEGAKEAGAEVELFFVSDATVEDFKNADAVALGCPACGDEELEDSEFAPYIDSIEEFSKGKKMLLFGSYSWHEGGYMDDWADRMKAAGADLINSGIVSNEAPNDDIAATLREAGKQLATA